MTTQKNKKQAPQGAQVEVSNTENKPFSMDSQIQQAQKKYDKARSRFTLAPTETETFKFKDTRLRVTATDDDGYVTVESVTLAETEIKPTGAEYEQTSVNKFGMSRDKALAIMESVPPQHKHLQGLIVCKNSNAFKPQNPYK